MFACNLKHLETKRVKKLANIEHCHVLITLVYLSECTWQDIIINKMKKYHEVPLTAIKTSIAKHYLKSQKTEGCGNNKKLISFAYSSAGRLLGFRKSDVFYLTYIDANHDYCKG